MPSTPRTSRPGAGPGRGKPRHRPVSRTPSTASVTTDELLAQEVKPPAPPRGIGVTRRAMILLAVVAFLVISYAGSLRIYLDTERQNAENTQKIQQSQAHIDELNAQLARWDDPDFVKAQARERLGWVMPGEVGYRVIGPDGQPIGTRMEPSTAPSAPQPPRTWWQRMWGAVKTADQPVPTPTPAPPTPMATPSERPPITDGTRTPTPKKSPTPTKRAG
ncbi:FtsB family cell division protein [Mariniluteicoccus endophyticus]